MSEKKNDKFVWSEGEIEIEMPEDEKKTEKKEGEKDGKKE